MNIAAPRAVEWQAIRAISGTGENNSSKRAPSSGALEHQPNQACAPHLLPAKGHRDHPARPAAAVSLLGEHRVELGVQVVVGFTGLQPQRHPVPGSVLLQAARRGEQLPVVVGRQYSIQPMISAFRSQRRASRIRRMRFSCPTGWPRIRRYSAISGQTCTDQVLPSHGRSPTRRRRRAARLCRFPGVLSRRRGRDPASKPQMSDSSSTSEAATVGSSALSAIVA